MSIITDISQWFYCADSNLTRSRGAHVSSQLWTQFHQQQLHQHLHQEGRERKKEEKLCFFSKGLLKHLHLGVKSNFRSDIILSQQVTLKERKFTVLLWSANQYHTISNI